MIEGLLLAIRLMQTCETDCEETQIIIRWTNEIYYLVFELEDNAE